MSLDALSRLVSLVLDVCFVLELTVLSTVTVLLILVLLLLVLEVGGASVCEEVEVSVLTSSSSRGAMVLWGSSLVLSV